MANKIFIDIYSSCKNDNDNNLVYILLLDSKIYTKVERTEMFEKNMHLGCFIDIISRETTKMVENTANELIERYSLKYVSVEDFIKIEKEKENERVAKAFITAEKMIREG